MTTNYSPYFLMFGREARYPIQVLEHYEVDGTVEHVVRIEVTAQDHNEQDQLFEQVREHIRKAQEKTRDPKTTSGTTPTVHIGDLVLKQNIRSQQRKGGKLNLNFLGPYKIVAIEGKTADLQDENGTLVPKINIDHLKPYKENKQKVPHRYENKKGASSWMTQSPSPPASAPPATAPPATAPPAAAPPTTAPSSTAPPAAAPPSTAPNATAPPAAAPPSTAPTATAPLASAPPAIAPSATAPPASAPPTTAPSPTAPPAAAPPTTVPSSTAPPAAAPPSTAPTATAPPASALPAIAPSATAPPASDPPTTAASPTAPLAAAPPTTAPSPTALPAAAPPSTAPTATAPPASAPPSTAPTTTAPPASAPPATAPSATAPSATASPATAPFSPALNTATPPRLSLTFGQTRENVDKYVQDAWKGKHIHVLLSKIGAYKLFFWDIMDVRPNSELESEPGFPQREGGCPVAFVSWRGGGTGSASHYSPELGAGGGTHGRLNAKWKPHHAINLAPATARKVACSPEGLRSSVLQWAHDSRLVCHPGAACTRYVVAQRFRWPTWQVDTSDYVRACSICNRCKTSTRPPAGLLQPLPVPRRPWSHLSIDFVTGLPPSEGNTVVLTVVDWFNKMTHFIPLPKLPSAKQTASNMVREVFRHHGLPQDIVSDRDPQFASTFWAEFCRLLGATASLSSGFHPQSNGQAERLNQELGRSLRCMAAGDQRGWVQQLPWVEYAHNSLPSSATGLSPFHRVFGYQPPLFAHQERETACPSAQACVRRCRRAWARARTALFQAAPAPEYRVGQRVWLSTQDLPQRKGSCKLAPHFVGPFPIQKVISPSAVRLLLPESMKVHPTFHMSRVRPVFESALVPVPPPIPGGLGGL
ncbi:uncharacterized protein LOC133169427 [Syngnathus typhle]|uniref:uncharacterized protein LOC133169427 n=1 Tax=Syngnathus typhle TaxID=161592 RepID=UPI002A6A6FCE|nr:uncharacterized protein LOC133169427 [Syngnathus typhle]XP_061157615.1 uncharacterized protein LOC133169427 [Syngnathus typhle]XP_061157616.1 uncharacterized protein LOC133169427 [Syngnathus typhle]XP_061157617.1 uncharacterized protein LOC133169427 [Syngnathus typhle]XP_061157618.1 uncharacterized protein LOC133169427 [Syngnathus typhle]XP_061157619.1 uncharacterized protein LOC133169427 [Syngnathus typhle]